MNKIRLNILFSISLVCNLVIFELYSSTVTRSSAGDYIFYRQKRERGEIISCAFNTKNEAIYCSKQIKLPGKSFRIIKIRDKNMRYWFDTLKSRYEKQQKALTRES